MHGGNDMIKLLKSYTRNFDTGRGMIYVLGRQWRKEVFKQSIVTARARESRTVAASCRP